MERERLPKRILNLKVKGTRPMGRPRESLVDQIQKNLQERGYKWDEINRNKVREDRDEWRHIWNRPSKRRTQ